jgi:hypothetical protein
MGNQILREGRNLLESAAEKFKEGGDPDVSRKINEIKKEVDTKLDPKKS